jgi:SEC-C motif-containing protein
MRSRYAAFAKKECAYLWTTLAPEHEDRARDEAEVMREIRANVSLLKFMGLRVLSAREWGDRAEVTFLARVFEKGNDHSFVERSEFRRVDGAWRYVGALEGPRAPTNEEAEAHA